MQHCFFHLHRRTSVDRDEAQVVIVDPVFTIVGPCIPLRLRLIGIRLRFLNGTIKVNVKVKVKVYRLHSLLVVHPCA